MRSSIVTAAAICLVLSIASRGLSQEASLDTPRKAPLEILDECVRAVQQRDFGCYVDHLSGDEQKVQAGYTLRLTSSILPLVEMDSEQIEPEMVLLLRALGDLVQAHRADDLGQNGGSATARAKASFAFEHDVQYFASVIDGDKSSMSGSRIREDVIKSTEVLKDPRLFLIATLTEMSLPVQIAGSQPSQPNPLPDLVEFAKAFQRLEWTLYTRGDYAIAVPAKRAVQTGPPVADSAPTLSKSAPEPWPARVEFRKFDGVWKISHFLPITLLKSLAPATSAATAGICTGPECNANPATRYVPAEASPYHSAAPQSPAALSPNAPRE